MTAKEITINAKCWNCRFCYRESGLLNGKWKQLQTGNCLAENSAVNGSDLQMQKVFADSVQHECARFEPRDEFL